MVGDPRMTLHGWRQLAAWSIEHACLDDEQKSRGLAILDKDWEAYCKWIVAEYSEYANS
jgi:adenosine deaminase CECR1